MIPADGKQGLIYFCNLVSHAVHLYVVFRQLCHYRKKLCFLLVVEPYQAIEDQGNNKNGDRRPGDTQS
jgi:hypothetical protein